MTCDDVRDQAAAFVLGALFVSAFWQVDSFTGKVVHDWTLANFRSLVEDDVYRKIALRTIGMAAAVTVADAVLAFPLAYFMARVAPPAPSPQALGALLRRCRLVVANDGGVVHVATAVGTPVVAIFGPTNERAWAPYPTTDPRHQVVREVLACAPCIHRGHSFGTPQGCPARTCLAILEVSDVLAAAERALAPEPLLVGER